MVGELKYEQEREQGQGNLDANDATQQELAKQAVEPDDSDDSDKHHTTGTEKMSMAGGSQYRQEREQTSLDAGYKCR